MYRKKLITALAVGASCAGLIPAAMAGEHPARQRRWR